MDMDLPDGSQSTYEESAPEPTPILDAALSTDQLVRSAESRLRRKGYGVQRYTLDRGLTWITVLTAPYTKERYTFEVDRLESLIQILRTAEFTAPEFKA